jgi:NADH:ubiquinone oxidoreductase subunit E
MPVAEPDAAVLRADEVASTYPARRRSLIHILQDVQESFGYVPRPALERVAERLGIPLSEALRVATFYAAFSLEPRGEHLVSVCMGTACHVKGAPRILSAVRRVLNLTGEEATTADGRFTLKAVRCIGCCGLAPVLTVDGTAHGRLTPNQVAEVLARYE